MGASGAGFGDAERFDFRFTASSLFQRICVCGAALISPTDFASVQSGGCFARKPLFYFRNSLKPVEGRACTVSFETIDSGDFAGGAVCLEKRPSCCCTSSQGPPSLRGQEHVLPRNCPPTAANETVRERMFQPERHRQPSNHSLLKRPENFSMTSKIRICSRTSPS